ncbi:hypothetical protein EDB89DRAFT_402592 [Lactarius sanguifluus]|nr:hypothetical protein EDB89DRAFT_402592 [Lactarius sanguifluus]
MSPAKSSQVVTDEETPLLHDGGAQRKPTPLPKTQLFLLLLVRLAEPIASHSISPYISERRQAESGLLHRVAPEIVTVLQWSRCSDHIGRKPILLLGLACTVVTILFRAFPFLLGARPQSMIPELTDDTRRFSLLSVARVVGYMIGPFIDDVLSRSQDHCLNRFSHSFGLNIHISCCASSPLPMPLYHPSRDDDVFGRDKLPETSWGRTAG